MRRRLFALWVTSLGWGFVSTTTAHAGNGDEMLLGTHAVLMGGAVTATVQDGTALWFNPAGLVGAASNTLDVSASAFTARRYEVPRFLFARTGQSSNGNLWELTSVPSALTYVRNLGRNWYLGLGVFVSRYSDFTLRSHLQLSNNDAPATQWSLALSQSQALQHAGVGIGWRPWRDLQIGASLFGVYARQSNFLQFAGGQDLGDGMGGSVTSSTLESQNTIGLQAALGAAWKPKSPWSAGVAVQSPGYLIANFVSSSVVSSAAAIAPGQSPAMAFESNRTNKHDFGFRPALPARVRGGVAYMWRKGQVSIDGDVFLPLRAAAVDTRYHTQWNVRAGARVHVGRLVTVGGGVFTDRDTEDDDTNLNFYGFSFGIEYGRARRILAEDSEKQSKIRFTTSFGLRYAYGSGNVSGLQVAPFDINNLDVASPHVPLRIHEFTIYIGSSIHL